MVLFIPGYALIAALFPGKGDLDGIERLALSFGLSIAVVPLIGLALNFTPFGIRLDPILASLVLFTIAMAVVAQYRRSVLPRDQRFSVPLAAIAGSVREEVLPREASRADRLLSIALACAIFLAVAATIYVIVVPKEGEHFTEFYILGPGGKAADYPSQFRTGEEQEVLVGIGNHEYRAIPYAVEVFLANVTFDPATNTSSVGTVERIDRWIAEVPDNTTVERRFRFTVNDPRFNRIEFLLWNETVAGDEISGADRVNASYRDLHLWIDVTSR
jgi:uncharacterized membrane protein